MTGARWRERLLRHRALGWPLLIALLASVFLLRDLGERRLQKSDEALFAAAALQMTRDGGVLYPARGEFGAYDKGPMDSRVRYTAAVARTAEKLGWSWAYWQFDSDFILYDIDNDHWVQPIRDALIPNDP